MTFFFNSWRFDIEPNVTVKNDINLTIDGENIDGLKGEVGKDASMRLILISLVMVVIGLLCFSIFSDDVKNDPSPDIGFV